MHLFIVEHVRPQLRTRIKYTRVRSPPRRTQVLAKLYITRVPMLFVVAERRSRSPAEQSQEPNRTIHPNDMSNIINDENGERLEAGPSYDSENGEELRKKIQRRV